MLHKSDDKSKHCELYTVYQTESMGTYKTQYRNRESRRWSPAKTFLMVKPCHGRHRAVCVRGKCLALDTAGSATIEPNVVSRPSSVYSMLTIHICIIIGYVYLLA